MRLAGDVAGLTVLDVCCASSADEAFSWENLGASVIGCDISPAAIDIARQNAQRIGLRATFFMADAQELAPMEPESVDLVYGRYLCWFEDIEKTLRTWYHVPKPGGRLLICTLHPITSCLEEHKSGFELVWSYDNESPDYADFTGTNLADLHGGWGERHPSAEFFHPTWRIVNAVVDAGFRIVRMEEPVSRTGSQDGRMKLPHVLVILAEK